MEILRAVILIDILTTLDVTKVKIATNSTALRINSVSLLHNDIFFEWRDYFAARNPIMLLSFRGSCVAPVMASQATGTAIHEPPRTIRNPSRPV